MREKKMFSVKFWQKIYTKIYSRHILIRSKLKEKQ